MWGSMRKSPRITGHRLMENCHCWWWNGINEEPRMYLVEYLWSQS
jgi:hypothetical protein